MLSLTTTTIVLAVLAVCATALDNAPSHGLDVAAIAGNIHHNVARHGHHSSIHKKRAAKGKKRCPTRLTGQPSSSLQTATSSGTKPAQNVATGVPKPAAPSSAPAAPVNSTKTQAGAAPATTVASSSDPYLLSLSRPLNYALAPEFVRPKTGGVMTYYGQGQTACGDTYDDTTYTAAISHLVYDAWPGASGETNRNPVCGPFVSGRYFLLPTDERVKGTSHATMGGDGLINCQLGEQCHIPLTATVTNHAIGVSFKVHIVDRCANCAPNDIDLAPAAFLKLTVPDLDTSKFQLGDYMAEASKNVLGRVPVTWKFDPIQTYGGVRGEEKSGCAQGCVVGA